MEQRAARLIGGGAVAVAIAIFACAALVAATLPFGEWDAMAFGTWAREIAGHWPHLRFADQGPIEYHRPLFYFLEGTLWRVFGFHQALGRALSLVFAAVFAAAVAYAAARSAARRYAVVAAALALGLVLATAPFEHYVVSGLTDVPVAALVALTAALLFTRRWPLVAVAACLALLTKPTALSSLAGLAIAVLVGPRATVRRRAPAAAAIAAGTAVALVYDAVQAHLSHVGLATFLTAGGKDAFYTALAASHRRDALLDESWLGADLRLLLLFALVYAVLRLRVAHRAAVAAALPVAFAWSVAGAYIAGGHGLVAGSGGPFRSAVVLALAASLLFALAAPADAVSDRVALARLLVWAAPPLLLWIVYSVYDVRLLSAAWPPLLLLMTRAVLPAVAGAARLDARAALVPAAAVLLLAALGGLEINGFGSDGWHRFGSALGDRVALRSLALGGDFSAELTAIEPQLASTRTIITEDSRLRFYFPDKVALQPPGSCAQLRAPGSLLVLLESDEERTLYGERATSAYWEECRHPAPTMVAERPGAFAVFSAHNAVAVAGGCALQPVQAGLAVEFGRFRNAPQAEALLAQAKGLGFVQAQVAQVGCASWAVVETGVPNRAVGRSILAEAKSAHLQATLVDLP